MKRWIALETLLLCFVSGFVAAQAELDYTHVAGGGIVVDGTYRNPYFDLVFPLPEGFYDATHELQGSKPLSQTFLLLVADRHTEHAVRDRILLYADDARYYRPSMSALQYLQKLTQAEVSLPGVVVRKKPAVLELNGEHYVRSDYSRTEAGITLYNSMIVGKVHGYWLLWTFVSASNEDLEHNIASLGRISYATYHTEPADPPAACVPASGHTPERVRVSEAFAQKLLITRVEPEYPVQALERRVQGTVVFRVLIDEYGVVRETTYVSGDPLLRSAAMDAVSKWRFQPYELNCTSVQLETQMGVTFSLAPKPPG